MKVTLILQIEEIKEFKNQSMENFISSMYVPKLDSHYNRIQFPHLKELKTFDSYHKN